jgi:endonuclease/exonuclease/phosphatase family metal-dependent hydrolase
MNEKIEKLVEVIKNEAKDLEYDAFCELMNKLTLEINLFSLPPCKNITQSSKPLMTLTWNLAGATSSSKAVISKVARLIVTKNLNLCAFQEVYWPTQEPTEEEFAKNLIFEMNNIESSSSSEKSKWEYRCHFAGYGYQRKREILVIMWRVSNFTYVDSWRGYSTYNFTRSPRIVRLKSVSTGHEFTVSNFHIKFGNGNNKESMKKHTEEISQLGDCFSKNDGAFHLMIGDFNEDRSTLTGDNKFEFVKPVKSTVAGNLLDYLIFVYDNNQILNIHADEIVRNEIDNKLNNNQQISDHLPTMFAIDFKMDTKDEKYPPTPSKPK